MDYGDLCKNGHEFSGDNLRLAANGTRMCVICYKNKLEKNKIERRLKRLKNEGRRL